MKSKLKRGLGSPNMPESTRKRICSAGGKSHPHEHYVEAGRLGALAGHAKKRMSMGLSPR